MGINLSMPTTRELKPRIVVFGVGGAGGNAVNNMINAQLEGVEFVAANTDAQSINMSLTERRIQLGVGLTQGLGCGAKPDVGRAAAEESIEQIVEHLQGCHMAFVAAGMGGGTGTGAAPVIARAAKEMGILTVGVVTKPFSFEGSQRMRLADAGIRELQEYVDTLIIIPNQNLFRVANEKTTFADAFKMADNVLQSGVRGITDLMVMPGLINLDFADVRSVMSEMGKAMMGTGEADGDHRAIEAAERAIANPLLDDISMKGARGVLINITGGPDLTLFEVDEAANRIREEVDPEANIIVGSTLDANMEGRMRVSVVATGIDAAAQAEQKPQAAPALRLVTPPQAKPVNFGAAAPKPAMPPAAMQPATGQSVPATMAAQPVSAGATALAMCAEQHFDCLLIEQSDLVEWFS
ncbi:cell division protein FtsZ, partial [Ferrovibrio sp.]|uniref:cell division protein FtsZ n=1 Tax=Ferrovibrio sp. TaxID=1917215 RepID=UPI00311FC4BC